MLLKQVIEIIDIIDDAYVNGKKVVKVFGKFENVKASFKTIHGQDGKTDFIKIIVQGKNGKLAGGSAPTLGIIGRLGGIGARPSRIGMVSDADGAVAAISAALKLSEMTVKGDRLEGDIIISTHICPDAPTQPHEPVDFMGSPVDMMAMNEYEVDNTCDAILSIDTTKGNNIMNYRGIAISPVVKEGYILPVSSDLVRIVQTVTGEPAKTYPITMQDITPYGNNLYHINSILQPAIATNSPVVGVAITAATAVPGCGTGASHETDIAYAATFAIEVAKEYTNSKFEFYNKDEFKTLIELYGTMNHLQTLGKGGVNYELKN